MVSWWLPIDLPDILANTNCLKTWLVLIERFFWGLSIAIKTVRIIKESMEIGPNEVCDTWLKKYDTNWDWTSEYWTLVK